MCWSWEYTLIRLRVGVWRPLTISCYTWQVFQILTIRLTQSLRLQYDKVDDSVLGYNKTKEMTELSQRCFTWTYILILHWTSSWFYLMCPWWRDWQTRQISYRYQAAPCLWSAWCFVEWTIDAPRALQCFMRLFSKASWEESKNYSS